MYPILTRLGPFFIYSYTAVFAVGLGLSWAVSYRVARVQRLPNWQDAALSALIGGWLGARLSFIMLNWSYFAERPEMLWRLWQGGLTAYGGLLGGLVGLWLWCRQRERPFLPYANFFAFALLLLGATGWAACWFEGCAFGAETVLGPLSADLPDTFGVFAVRYQTQLLGVLLHLIALGALLWWERVRGNGRLFILSLLMINLIHFGLTFLRGDAVPGLAFWRVDTWLALLFATAALFLLQYEP